MGTMPAKKATAARATVDDLAKLQQALAEKLIEVRRVIAPRPRATGPKETEGSGEDYPIQIRASRWPAKYPWAVRAVAAIDAACEALRNVMVCHSQVVGRRTLPDVLADMSNSGEPYVLAVLERLRGITELPARETNLGLIERLVRELGGKVEAAAVEVRGAVFSRAAGTLTLNGKPLSLTTGERHVLKRLLETGTATLTQLKPVHDHPDRVLKRLRKKHKSLAKHIFLPGGPGKGGYSTTIVAGE